MKDYKGLIEALKYLDTLLMCPCGESGMCAERNCISKAVDAIEELSRMVEEKGREDGDTV